MTVAKRALSSALFAAIALAVSACGGAGSPAASTPLSPRIERASAIGGKYFKHIVIIVQENRSFDNIFAGFPGADAPMQGLDSHGKTIPLHQILLNDSANSGPPHGWIDAIREWNKGKMNGWDIGIPGVTGLYAYVARSQTAPYWTMAKEYTLADRMFPIEFGPSFTAHLDLIASTTNVNPGHAVVDVPNKATALTGWGCAGASDETTNLIGVGHVYSAGAGPFPCFTQFRTLADTLDAAGVSWRYYAPQLTDPGGLWSAFQAISNVYHGPDWQRNVVSPPSTVLTDAASNNLASVSWVIPESQNSDHAAAHSDTGPSWVASVVNAIGKSPAWKSTAIIVLWDDWGGWYDDAAPPQVNYVGRGIRVGCLIIAPYAKHGKVSHTAYDFGSTVRLIEDNFALPALGLPKDGYDDRTAPSMLDSFDFTQQAPAFKAIPAKYSADFFLHQTPDGKAPDDD